MKIIKCKKDLVTIPNLICYLRILLIPVFCYVYLTAQTTNDYYLAVGIVIFSSFTDLFDGMIARKFNQVTELGKILDPVADKLTHGALALCIAIRYPLMLLLILVMVIKEGYMAIKGIKYLNQGKMMDGAMWYGKVCTATLFIVLCILFGIYNLNAMLANGLIIITTLLMLFTLYQYIRFYQKF